MKKILSILLILSMCVGYGVVSAAQEIERLYYVKPFATVQAFKIKGSDSHSNSDTVDVSDKTVYVDSSCSIEAAYQVVLEIYKIEDGTTLEQFKEDIWDENTLKYTQKPDWILSSMPGDEDAPTSKVLTKGTYAVCTEKGGNGVYTLLIVGNENKASESELPISSDNELKPEKSDKSTYKTPFFNDVKKDDTYTNVIVGLGYINLFKGDDNGNFNPDSTITRAEFSAIVCRMLGYEKEANNHKGKTVFDDVPANHWASGYIYVASRLGIINGYGNGKFGPNDSVLFEQAVKMLVCATGYDSFVFAEQNNIPCTGGEVSYPVGYLVMAGKFGFTVGASGVIGNPIQRRSVAMLLYNAINLNTVRGDKDYALADGEPLLKSIYGIDSKEEFDKIIENAKKSMPEKIDPEEPKSPTETSKPDSTGEGNANSNTGEPDPEDLNKTYTSGIYSYKIRWQVPVWIEETDELIVESHAIIVSVNSSETSVNIPERIDGYKVGLIDKDAFLNSNITDVFIPATVTDIGTRAMRYGYNSSFVTEESFESDILKNINVAEGNKNYASIDGVLFNKSKTKLLSYPKGRCDEKYTIPECVDRIYGAAFANNIYLKEVIVPGNVKIIESGAFAYCKNLEKAIFKNGVEEIRDYAFLWCERLDSIYLPASLKKIYTEIYTFSKADSLRRVFYEGNKEQWSKITNGYDPEGNLDAYHKDVNNAIVYFNCVENGIIVIVNGEKIDFNAEPIVKNDYTLVSLENLCTGMNMQIEKDNNNLTIYGSKKVDISVGSDIAKVNGEKKIMVGKAQNISGYIFAPIKSICEIYSANLQYDSTFKLIDIAYKPELSVPLMFTKDSLRSFYDFSDPLKKEYAWEYNEAEIFGGENEAREVLESIEFGPQLIIGATEFYKFFIDKDFSILVNKNKNVYDQIIEELLVVDENLLKAASQRNVEVLLEESGNIRQMKKDFDHIEEIYKAAYGDEEGFGAYIKNKLFDEGLDLVSLGMLSEGAIDAVSKYLTIMSLYDSYSMTQESINELLACMEADGIEREFVSYAKEKMKSYEDVDARVIAMCKAGAATSLNNLFKKIIEKAGEKGVEVIGKNFDIEKEMQAAFGSSVKEGLLKLLYAFVSNSPTVETAQNYVTLSGMRILSAYSKNYFSETVESVKGTKNFYEVNQQKKIKNLAIVSFNIAIKSRNLLSTLLEIPKDTGFRKYIKTIETQNDTTRVFVNMWERCEIVY